MSGEYSLDRLVRQMMANANDVYRSGSSVAGLGFIVSTLPVPRPDGVKYSCALVHAGKRIENLKDLRRFATTLGATLRGLKGIAAGIMVEMEVKLDEGTPEEMVVIYTDELYGGIHVYLAPLRGDSLVFRDLGTASPAANFFPALFTSESYPTPVTEA